MHTNPVSECSRVGLIHQVEIFFFIILGDWSWQPYFGLISPPWGRPSHHLPPCKLPAVHCHVMKCPLLHNWWWFVSEKRESREVYLQNRAILAIFCNFGGFSACYTPLQCQGSQIRYEISTNPLSEFIRVGLIHPVEFFSFFFSLFWRLIIATLFWANFSPLGVAQLSSPLS